jgi:hypothetical protein
VQDDDRALLGSQPPESQVEQVAIGDDRLHVGHRRSIDRKQLDLLRPSASTSEDIDTRARYETAEPGLEAIRIAERRKVSPGSKESILDRVSRELVVPKDQAGRCVQPRDEHAGKHGEGVMIASLRSLDELSLVHGPPSA